MSIRFNINGMAHSILKNARILWHFLGKRNPTLMSHLLYYSATVLDAMKQF